MQGARCAEDSTKLCKKAYTWDAFWDLVVKPADKQVLSIYGLSKLL